MMQPQAPNAPNAPTLAPSQITIAGAPLGGPTAVYEAFKAQRSELANQLEAIQDTRRDLTSQLNQFPTGNVARTGIEQRIAALDGRIVAMDKAIADADAQVARAAAVPGAVVEPPPFVRQGPPDEVWVLTGIFIIAVLLPNSVAYARRIWKRIATEVMSIPKELSERLGRVENAVEATAVEIERIGEGQRFLTRLFTEGSPVRAIGPASAELVERKSGDAGQVNR
jgi:hypothetical protein